MKVGRIVGLGVLAGLGLAAVRVIKQYREDSAFDLAPITNAGGTPTLAGGKRTISPELLEILACPLDKGPVELVESDGKQWLVNRRNGYRYPVDDGIPIMLIEEGEKNRDTSLITS